MCLFVLWIGYKEEEKENMEDWDQETLEKVVESKSNEYNKNKPTDIVSHLFIDYSNLFYIFHLKNVVN